MGGDRGRWISVEKFTCLGSAVDKSLGISLNQMKKPRKVKWLIESPVAGSERGTPVQLESLLPSCQTGVIGGLPGWEERNGSRKGMNLETLFLECSCSHLTVRGTWHPPGVWWVKLSQQPAQLSPGPRILPPYTLLICLFIYLFICLFSPLLAAMWHAGSSFLDQGSNPHPLQHWARTPEPPGTSWVLFILNRALSGTQPHLLSPEWHVSSTRLSPGLCSSCKDGWSLGWTVDVCSVCSPSPLAEHFAL